MMKSAVIITILLLSSFVASAETVYTVDCNGGGDFRTIQAATFSRMLFRRRVMKYWITPRRNM